jgi:hypothetical protein
MEKDSEVGYHCRCFDDQRPDDNGCRVVKRRAQSSTLRWRSLMSSSSGSLFCKRNWEETLARVERTLGNAIAAAHERERLLEQFIHSGQPDADASCPWQRDLEDYFQHLRTLRAKAEKAGLSVADVDAALAESEETLRQWLASTEAARAKLSGWLAQSR